MARYAEPWRAYHVIEHVIHCLEELDRVRGLAADADAAEAALWFHDAVYLPGADDNEERSAALADAALALGGVSPERRNKVGALILATRHDAEPADPDARLVVDADLAVLGSDAVRFDAYEHAIRREYAAVPDRVFRTRRSAILQAFLGRPHIYATAPFQARYEAAARRNLARSLAALEAGSGRHAD